MAGGTTNHNEIITNFCLILKPTIRQQQGKIYTENVRLWIPQGEIFTYPDVMIILKKPFPPCNNKKQRPPPRASI